MGWDVDPSARFARLMSHTSAMEDRPLPTIPEDTMIWTLYMSYSTGR